MTSALLHAPQCQHCGTAQLRRPRCTAAPYLGTSRQHRHKRVRATASDSDNKPESHQHAPSLQEVADQCFQDSPETKQRLQRVGNVAAQVAALQAAQADIQRQMRRAAEESPTEQRRQERQQAQAASERGSQADVVHAAEELQAAANEFAAAQSEKAKWQTAIDEAGEKVESAKAGAIAGVGGTLASLPYVLAAGHPPLASALSLGSCLASCVLFGVTFRYAVRQDLQNLQLKGGVVAAFGLVRGSAQADMLQLSTSQGLSVDFIAQAALAAGESVLSFAFAAVALELAFKNDLLQPFGFTSAKPSS